MEPISYWIELLIKCPFECEVSCTGEDGEFVQGRMTVKYNWYSYTFYHPGFKYGKITIFALGIFGPLISDNISIRY